MKRSSVLSVLIFAVSFVLSSKEFVNPLETLKPLSIDAEFSLLTCDQGNQLYATFGHSALRLYDPVRNVDLVFNYGTFDFNTPNFYGKFASGRLLYTLSVESRSRFMVKYVTENLTVVEQKLDLSYYQKQQMYDFIVNNYEPENRYYKYDFIYDNCATRIVDLFEKTFKESLVYYPVDSIDDKTFRDILHEYLVNSKWSDFGIKIMLGNVVDVQAGEKERTFMPNYLMEYCRRLELSGKPLIKEETLLIPGGAEVPLTPFFISPLFIILLIFLVFVFFQIYKRKADWIIVDKTIFYVIGIVGSVIFLETLFTDHFATQHNFNVLWANPLYIWLAVLVSLKQTKLKLILSLILIAGNVVVLLGWGTIQVFHPLIVPFMIISSVRLVAYLLKYRK